jgi:glycosyltransferase involved in cell wall biosynthesis
VRTVHFVVPATIDSPATPSGGNRYDRRVGDELRASGWDVCELHDLAALDSVPDGGAVLVDGLLGCPAPAVMAAQAGRLRLVILVHLPLADETGLTASEAAALDALERDSLHAVAAVVATSSWTAARLIAHHDLPPSKVHVAVPGVDPAPLTVPSVASTGDGSRLLCVAAVTPRKGHDLLLSALASLGDLQWTCVCVGALDRAPSFVASLPSVPGVRFAGPLTGAALADCFAAADLMVLASRAEPYGMVVTEALACGVPVLATAVDGLPEALGRTSAGDVPGLLVPPDDAGALAAALRRWLTEPSLREQLRATARVRRSELPDWSTTARALARVLESV